jgi:hypothetical protein
MEVRTHAGAQVDGFANVDDLPLGVLHQIAARLGGQGIEDALDMLGDFHARNFNISLTAHFGT